METSDTRWMPLVLTPEILPIVDAAIHCYTRAVTQATGRMALEKWTLARETMQRLQVKVQAIGSLPASVWCGSDETWALSIALRLYLRVLDQQPADPQVAQAAGYCFLLRYQCLALLSAQEAGQDG